MSAEQQTDMGSDGSLSSSIQPPFSLSKRGAAIKVTHAVIGAGGTKETWLFVDLPEQLQAFTHRRG